MPWDRFCSEIRALRPVRALKGIACKSLGPSLTPIMRVRVHGSSFSNIQRSPAHHCFTALTCEPPRVEHRARLGVCIRCGCDRFFGTRALEATGINPLHRRRHPATAGRPASGCPGSRLYRRWSRTTTFGQKLVTFVSRATASSRRRCPRGLEARRAAGAPSQALRGGGTGLGLVMGYANARGTPPRRSPAAWRLPVSGRTVYGSQLAVRGRFWAAGAPLAPAPGRPSPGMLLP